MVKDHLEIKSDYQNNMSVIIQGKAMAKTLYIEPRIEWKESKTWWDVKWSDYPDLGYPSSGDSFPTWLKNESGLDPQPRIWIKPPDTETARYHWYNGNNPLFKQVKDPNGNNDGLRWELISWTDNP